MVSPLSLSYFIFSINSNIPAADERCAALLEVDPEHRERRNQLKKEKERIQEAKRSLENLTHDDYNMIVDDPFSG